jgi:hypothetical protein
VSIRWRVTGELLCAAKSEPRKDDCYIDDRLHYRLSVELRVIAPDDDEETTGRWHWAGGCGGPIASKLIAMLRVAKPDEKALSKYDRRRWWRQHDALEGYLRALRVSIAMGGHDLDGTKYRAGKGGVTALFCRKVVREIDALLTDSEEPTP